MIRDWAHTTLNHFHRQALQQHLYSTCHVSLSAVTAATSPPKRRRRGTPYILHSNSVAVRRHLCLALQVTAAGLQLLLPSSAPAGQLHHCKLVWQLTNVSAIVDGPACRQHLRAVCAERHVIRAHCALSVAYRYCSAAAPQTRGRRRGLKGCGHRQIVQLRLLIRGKHKVSRFLWPRRCSASSGPVSPQRAGNCCSGTSQWTSQWLVSMWRQLHSTESIAHQRQERQCERREQCDKFVAKLCCTEAGRAISF